MTQPKHMQLKSLFCTSVGKKFIVGITGVGLSVFVLSHMAGNMLLLCGPEAFNTYGHKLVTTPGFLIIESMLALCFLVHIGMALKLTLENRAARPVGPSQNASCEKAARFGSRWMALTGLFVLAFLVLHLATFKYGAHYTITHNGVEMRDLYKLVIEKFQDPLYTGFYIFSLVLLWVHLSHGVSAIFQSLGISGVRNKMLKRAGWAFAIFVSAGFMSQPIYAILTGGVK